MSTQHGFTLIRETEITEYRIQARLYRHNKTGAELLSLRNDDPNKVFGITFRTPPSDSTGVAHILEHSVLCGSRKYPVKEPFVELLKGSLQTFLNAFTYPDKTCYPVASQNLQDFYNLVDIYMDAVLHPLLARHTHEQEAWHYEMNSVGEPPIYKGVVFNEMKGVYAAADSILEEHGKRVLFPDTTYGVDYGGDPRHIPDLTWEQLLHFHRTFYHLSNARIYFYGDDPEDERLRRMNAYLAEYDHKEIDSQIAGQPADRVLPPSVTVPFPAQEGEDADLVYLTVNWRLSDQKDPEFLLGLTLLEEILTETSASPLRKALIDSELGDDLAGGGLETHVREVYFSTGLKGITPGDEAKVETLIVETLRQLVKDGIDPKTIEAAINTEEFHLRELNTGNYPRGLSIMVSALQTWIYDEDPLAMIRYQAPLDAIKKRIAAGERYFETLIETCLLKNPHRVTLHLKPDPDLKNRLDREEAAKLEATAQSWTDAEKNAVVARTAELKRIQSTPDRPEDLRCIPNLAISDLDKKNAALPIDVGSINGTPYLFHDLFTQGISYLDIGFNLAVIPDDLLGLVPVWAKALLETGTAKEDYVSLSQRIGCVTGGIDPELYASTIREQPDATAWVFLRGKAMDQNLGHLLDIVDDILTSVRLDNRERISQLIAEEKSDLESGVIPSGHRFVAQRLRARFNEADMIQEKLTGISYLMTLRDLTKRMDTDWTSILQQLKEIHTLMTGRGNLLINLTASGASRAGSERLLSAFLARRDDRPPPSTHRAFASCSTAPEGLIIPAQVNYVGKSVNLYRHGRTITGHALVVNRYLRTAWLWDQVRVQGGAYGAFCMLDPRAGQFTMTSYRDPNTVRTIGIYNQTAEYLKQLSIDHDELTRAIVGAIGDMDGYLLPDAKGFISMGRHLSKDSDEKRQVIRDQILSTTLDHFHAFADDLAVFAEHGQVVIMGSREKLSDFPDIALQPVL